MLRRAAVAALAVAFAEPSFALSPEFIDKFASGLALFIIFFMPILLISLFWIVHVLPEKIAERRHHPQKDAIHVLCLLSLVFGGLLWPLAWLWAFTKPVFHKMAYGTDRHDDYYADRPAAATAADPSAEATSLRAEIAELNRKLAAIEARDASQPGTGGAS